MNNDDDNWLKSAINDAELVAHVLLKLRQPSPSSFLSPPPKTWTIRQRRSRPPQPAAAKKSSATRASPTTPLSWSGATSVSGGGVGVEESSRLALYAGSDISRSKVIRVNETTPTKRPRKKKTLAELKEDEMALLKERKQLKRQLASLQATCQKQRKENESLKKMKNDMKLQQVLVVSGCTEEQENIDSFVLPDLNIPADGDC